MHLPDGFLAPSVWIPMAVASAGAVAFAARKARTAADPERVPLMGVLGAFVFATQMINFPVAAGTSGHLVGGVLLAVLLGPHVATLVMTAVFVVQCFLFQDGGVTTLGANIFNMGIVGTYGGTLLYRGLHRLLPRRVARVGATMGACWLSIVVSAALVAVELGLSGVVDIGASLVAMCGVHAVIGLGEGAVTVGVLGFLSRVRPDLLAGEASA